MTTITTKLVKDGNSTAVRLPKSLLKMSGLGHTVELEAKKGRIIVRKAGHARQGWEAKIAAVSATTPVAGDVELSEWDETLLDGLDENKA